MSITFREYLVLSTFIQMCSSGMCAPRTLATFTDLLSWRSLNRNGRQCLPKIFLYTLPVQFLGLAGLPDFSHELRMCSYRMPVLFSTYSLICR